MGRANIAFSLLKKNIVSKHVVRWVENIVRHSKDDKGELQYSLFAILSMFVSSKMLSFSVLGATALPQQRSPENMLYPSLLKNLRIPLLRDLLHKSANGIDDPNFKERVLGNTWAQYSMLFEQILRSNIKRFVDTFDVNRSAIVLSQSMMASLVPNNCLVACRTLMYMGMSKYLDDVNFVYNYLYKLNREKFTFSYNKLKSMIYMNYNHSRISLLSGNDYETKEPIPQNVLLVNQERDLEE
jgi:hypothetical protein